MTDEHTDYQDELLRAFSVSVAQDQFPGARGLDNRETEPVDQIVEELIWKLEDLVRQIGTQPLFNDPPQILINEDGSPAAVEALLLLNQDSLGEAGEPEAGANRCAEEANSDEPAPALVP